MNESTMNEIDLLNQWIETLTIIVACWCHRHHTGKEPLRQGSSNQLPFWLLGLNWSEQRGTQLLYVAGRDKRSSPPISLGGVTSSHLTKLSRIAGCSHWPLRFCLLAKLSTTMSTTRTRDSVDVIASCDQNHRMACIFYAHARLRYNARCVISTLNERAQADHVTDMTRPPQKGSKTKQQEAKDNKDKPTCISSCRIASNSTL